MALLDMDMDDDDLGVEQEKLEPTVMVCDTCDRCEGGRVGGDGTNVSLWRCLTVGNRFGGIYDHHTIPRVPGCAKT